MLLMWISKKSNKNDHQNSTKDSQDISSWLNLPSLKHRRKRGDIIQVYKIVNNIDDLSFDLFFQETLCKKTRTTGNKLYVKGNHHLNLRKNVFSNRVVNTWNNLTIDTKNSSNINIFKNRLDADPHFTLTKYTYDGRH